MTCIMTKPSETHSIKSLWAWMSPDQAKVLYFEQLAVANAHQAQEREVYEVFSETTIPQQSSHNSLCLGVSSWLLVGSKPADNHDEKPMQRELCDDCWGIVVSDRQPSQREGQPEPSRRCAGRARMLATTCSPTSSQQSCATWACWHFWGRF